MSEWWTDTGDQAEPAVAEPAPIPGSLPPPGAPDTDADAPVAEGAATLDGVATDEEMAPRKQRNWVRRFAIAGVALWTVAMLAAGVSVGTRQRIEPPPPPADIAVEVQTVEIPDAPAVEDAGEVIVVVPNVLGLTPTEAQAALADAGAAADLQVVEVPLAGPAGFVTNQSPPPGTDFTEPVKLSVSATVEVPAVVGSSFVDARSALEELGAQVVVRTEYREGVPADEVLTITPEAGPLPLEVELVVAAPPAQLDLDQLDPVDVSCSRDSGFGVAGDPQDEPVWTCGLRRLDSYRSVSWDLSADVSRLSFTAGVTDGSDPRARAVVSVVLDGTVVETQATSFGTPARFDLDTSGALRIEIVVRTDVSDEIFDDWDRSWVAVVDPVATGSAEALDELAGLNS